MAKTERVLTVKFMTDLPWRELSIESSSNDEVLLMATDLNGRCHYFPLQNVREWYCTNVKLTAESVEELVS